jgi:putative FmdB family regulatory protein
MPTYVYRCTHCAHEFERVQKITEPPRARCPRCRKRAERLITGGAGLLFKGSGFYITDYRSKQYREAERREKGESGAAGSSGGDGKRGSGGREGSA